MRGVKLTYDVPWPSVHRSRHQLYFGWCCVDLRRQLSAQPEASMWASMLVAAMIQLQSPGFRTDSANVCRHLVSDRAWHGVSLFAGQITKLCAGSANDIAWRKYRPFAYPDCIGTHTGAHLIVSPIAAAQLVCLQQVNVVMS